MTKTVSASSGKWVVAMNHTGRPVVCPREDYEQLRPCGLIGEEITSSNSFDEAAKEAAHRDPCRTLH